MVTLLNAQPDGQTCSSALGEAATLEDVFAPITQTKVSPKLRITINATKYDLFLIEILIAVC